MGSVRGLSPSPAVLEVFDRHFAGKQFNSDVFGTSLGMLVYLSLIPSLAPLRRPELVAAAAACAALCMWPLALSRLSRRTRDVYLANRDYFLVAHWIFHYAVGGQFAHLVRLNNRLGGGSAAGFLASFLLSSTVCWQALDALMYRMRFHRFALIKPLVLLTTLPLEWRLCQLTCVARPEQSRSFSAAASALRLLLAPFSPVPTWMLAPVAASSPAVSCFKVQALLLLAFSWLLPAFVLRHLEAHMLAKFLGEHEAEDGQDTADAGRPAAAAAQAPGDAGKAAPSASLVRKAGADGDVRAAPLLQQAAHAQQQEDPLLAALLLCGALVLPAAVLTLSLVLCTAGAGLAVTLTAAAVAVALAAASAAAPQLQGGGGRAGRLVWRLQLPLRVLLRLTWPDGGGEPAKGEAGFAGLLGWPSWVLPLLLVSLCWHWIDAAL